MATSDYDFLRETWWKAPTVSGGGTISGSENFWWGDYTRHRTGRSDTYLSPDDIIGRVKTGRELDKGKH